MLRERAGERESGREGERARERKKGRNETRLGFCGGVLVNRHVR